MTKLSVVHFQLNNSVLLLCAITAFLWLFIFKLVIGQVHALLLLVLETCKRYSDIANAQTGKPQWPQTYNDIHCFKVLLLRCGRHLHLGTAASGHFRPRLRRLHSMAQKTASTN